METWHRITFNHRDGVDDILERLIIKHKKLPTMGEGYIICVDIAESDHQWSQIKALAQEKSALDMYNTEFTNEEILAAEQVRLMPVFEQGYPQPENEWKQLTYEGVCSECGTGYRQKAPFHFKKEPRMGKHGFLSLYATYSLFCSEKVLQVFEEHQLRGYELWNAIIHRSSTPSQLVRQMVVQKVAEPGLAREDKLEPEICSRCGTTKYAYHKRGYMQIRREAIIPDTDIQYIFEWFGSGRPDAYREILISNKFARIIVENKWRGLILKPIQLI